MTKPKHDAPVTTPVDTWLNGKPPTVRYVMFELKALGVIRAHASSDEKGDDGPYGFGKTYAEALTDLERQLQPGSFNPAPAQS